MKSPLILVAGAFGYGNVGDDAIGVATCRLLREIAPDVRIVVLGGEPSRTMQTMGEEARHLSWKSPLKAAALISLIRRASAVLIGGGGLLSDISHFYRPYYTLALTANALRTPVMFYAVGAYPPHTRVFKELTPRVMSRAAAVTVRDEFSMKALAASGVRAGVKLAADPAITLALPLRAMSRREDNRPLIGVSVRALPRGDAPPDHVVGLAKSLASCLDAVVSESGADLRFVPTHFGSTDDDADFQERVVRQMRNPAMIELSASQRPVDALQEIAGCDMLLGMRLHSNVLAAAAGVPSIALVYDPKVREFMRQLGCEDRALDIHSLQPAEVASCVVRLLADRQRATAELRVRVEEMSASARECAATAARLAGCAQPSEAATSLAMGA